MPGSQQGPEKVFVNESSQEWRVLQARTLKQKHEKIQGLFPCTLNKNWWANLKFIAVLLIYNFWHKYNNGTNNLLVLICLIFEWVNHTFLTLGLLFHKWATDSGVVNLLCISSKAFYYWKFHKELIMTLVTCLKSP